MASWQKYGSVRRRAAVTLDGSGNGSVTFDVQHANQRWIITYVVCSTTQTLIQSPYPTVTIYNGGAQQGVIEGASWTGNQETFEGRLEMTACDTLTVAFTGGIAGITATAVIEGDAELSSA